MSYELGTAQPQLVLFLVNNVKQAGAELCQAQVRLEVIFDVVEEAWS